MKLKSHRFYVPQIRRSISREGGGEAGVSLFLALILVLVGSMLAAGIIFSTQTEIWSTANYRSSTQARYVAEAGAQQAANWIIQNWTPPANLSDPTQFNLSVFPAQYVGGGSGPTKIVFASTTMGSIADTYTNISSSLDSNYKTGLHGVTSPFSGLNGNATFEVAAQLLSATQITVAGGSQWLTKWKIISQGSVGFIQPAKVQVVEIMADVPTQSTSSQAVPPFNYAVLATGTGCNVISATGGSGNPGRTNAYNSQGAGNVGNSSPTLLGTGGSVASFGNVSITNGAYINGPVYSPDYNLGTAGEYGISCPAWTNACGHNASGWNGGAACSGPSQIWSVNEDNSGSAVGCTNGGSCTNKTSNMPASLPNPSSVPDASMPSVTPNTSPCTALNGGLCNGGNGGGGGCAATLPPSPAGTSYGQVNFGSCANITLQSGIYNFDTLLISNGATIHVPSNGSVVINIFNSSGSSTPFTSNGGTIANPGGDPNNLTFVYDGSNTINLNNGAALFATIYAPHASVNLSGNGGLYGAIVGKTFNFTGSGHVIYDTHLASETPHITYSGSAITSTAHLDEFSWSSY
jgi:hypothetical protein